MPTPTSHPSSTHTLIAVLLIAASLRAGESVTWEPLGKVAREASV